ncbi:Unknown protein [Striga hermonthica]|uniref:Aminotransferase-like plant mobile domain-containing protein n=1 Tax=Striga hermonthica TaxID=68872 RepID=A0A9N7NKS0_STRHE|nr:Unknown protein [Striga hermonthica]
MNHNNKQDGSKRPLNELERVGDHSKPKRSKCEARKPSQTDSDDLVDDMSRRCLAEITKNQNVKGKNKTPDIDIIVEHDVDEADDIDVENNDDDVLPRVTTRSSAAMFVKAISNLSDVKKNVVRDMGFGCLLELSITTTSSKMGFWLVENFNHMDRKLQLYDEEKVHVKEDDVYAVFGLPRGEVEIKNKQKRVTSNLLDEWIALFSVRKPSNITASKVLDKMNECVDGGDWFRRHFIVLMVTCLFESCLNGMANFRLVHMLDDLSVVSKMNWCAYMIRCLVDMKRTWDSIGTQKKYVGPLLFLTLFYVDKVVLSVRSVPRTFPVFKSWSIEALRARERDEISSGAFSRGFVDVDFCMIVDNRRLDKVGPKHDGDVASVTEDRDLQAYVQEFASKTRLLATTGIQILQLVEKAPQVLLGDGNFAKMHDAA